MKLLTYLQFLNEDVFESVNLGTSHEITKTESGDHFYTHNVGDHVVMTHFYKRFSSKGGKHYDVHFTRHKPNSNKNASYGAFSRNGSKSMTPADRVKAARAGMSSLHHFVQNEKPASVTALGNTEKKNEWAHTVLNHIGKKTGGTVTKNGKESVLSYEKE